MNPQGAKQPEDGRMSQHELNVVLLLIGFSREELGIAPRRQPPKLMLVRAA